MALQPTLTLTKDIRGDKGQQENAEDLEEKYNEVSHQHAINYFGVLPIA